MTIWAKSVKTTETYGKIAVKRSLKETRKFKISSNNVSSNVTKQAVPYHLGGCMHDYSVELYDNLR